MQNACGAPARLVVLTGGGGWAGAGASAGTVVGVGNLVLQHWPTTAKCNECSYSFMSTVMTFYIGCVPSTTMTTTSDVRLATIATHAAVSW